MGDYFTDFRQAGVAARVAIQLVKREVRLHGVFRAPAKAVSDTTAALDGLAFPMVRLALLSLGLWVASGKRSRDWLSGCLYRDLMGYTFRRCFYDEYKGNRRAHPPVSNTGVRSLPLFSSLAEDTASQ